MRLCDRLKREQLRDDVVCHQVEDTVLRGSQAAPLPVAPGRIVLDTPHEPKTVRLSEIAGVDRNHGGRVRLRGAPDWLPVRNADVVAAALRKGGYRPEVEGA